MEKYRGTRNHMYMKTRVYAKMEIVKIIMKKKNELFT